MLSPIYDSVAWPRSTFGCIASQRQHSSAGIFDMITALDRMFDVPERINGDSSFAGQGSRVCRNGLPAELRALNVCLKNENIQKHAD